MCPTALESARSSAGQRLAPPGPHLHRSSALSGHTHIMRSCAHLDVRSELWYVEGRHTLVACCTLSTEALTEVDVGRQRPHLWPEQPLPSSSDPGTSLAWNACRPSLLLAGLGPEHNHFRSWMSFLIFAPEGPRSPSAGIGSSMPSRTA